ncbi:hypothetical protein LQ938_11680 [Microbacterium sp. cx-55]|uniref:hypothetical protein n=1 Tax=Microbacterium sp. cx-55 TaxID=2875948 RepID=UPI001CBD4906|nr:hypothetical protein [Microbacterium sp. cx-55]MBZ4488068.1 hypothetical protein [Microbacterium sp. cx-55]UGB34526.1 hypothetical protein LQ938_11680 [Microbacterium sp. cx-55]
MNHIDESTIIPNLVVGSIAVVLGILVMVFRRRLHAATAAIEHAIVGRRGAERLLRLQKPYWVGLAGFGSVMIGALMLFYGVVGLSQLSGG